jgi:uncharacterized damage-inducible protein DinB
MNTPEYFVLMAEYNAAMNRNVYQAAATLPHAELAADRKAFFGSILGTLNHLLAGDTIWLKRFAAHPADFPALRVMREVPLPAGGLAHSFGDDLAALATHRLRRDGVISQWAAQIRAEHLALPLEYRSSSGQVYRKDFGAVIAHFFNHQTHHRGQVSTLLTQAGVDIGVTDLLLWVPDQPPCAAAQS